jgi:hypothetical protein
MSWTGRARNAIWRAVANGRARGLDREAIIAAIDAAYPFGERANWPYKAWLAARKQALLALGRDPLDPLAGTCPACGAPPRRPCRQLGPDDTATIHAARVDGPLFEAGR